MPLTTATGSSLRNSGDLFDIDVGVDLRHYLFLLLHVIFDEAIKRTDEVSLSL
jgi:hypothetical protein